MPTTGEAEQAMNNHRIPVYDHAAPGSDAAEQHHGDLRKGAYLKRRAAYQLQASAPTMMQAGSHSTNPSERKNR